MTPVILRSRRRLMEDIKSLESQLSNLQERFNIIVNWINSQYCGFTGLPEAVTLAILANQPPIPIVTPEKFNTNRAKVVREETRGIKDEDLNVTGMLKCEILESDTLRIPNSTTLSSDEAEEEESLNSNPMVRLDNLVFTDIDTLTARHGIANLHSIKTAVMNIDSHVNSSSLMCNYCNTCFKLRIQLKKHQFFCQPKSIAVTRSSRSKRTLMKQKQRESNQVATIKGTDYDDVLSFLLPSDEEIDASSEPEYDPLGEGQSDFSDPETLWTNDGESILDVLGVESAAEVEIKEEIKQELTEEDNLNSTDPLIKIFQTNNSQADRKAEDSSLSLASEEKCPGDIWRTQDVKNTPVRTSSVNKKLVNASGLKEMLESKKPGSLNCIVCSKRFVTITQVRRHEMEVHLTKKEAIKFKKMTKKVRMRSFKINKILVSASEFKEMLESKKPGSLDCVVCSKRFQTIPQVRQHEIKFHLTNEEEEKFRNTTNYIRERSSRVNKILINASELKEMLATKEPGSLDCVVCNRRFEKTYHARKHEVTFHLSEEEERKFRNSTNYFRDRSKSVNKIIVDASKLEEMLTSQPPGSLNCAVCGKRSATKNLVRKHEMTFHLTKEEEIKFRKTNSLRQRSCKLNKILVKASKLKEMLSSTNPESLTCVVCNKTFAKISQVRRHELEFHLTKEEEIKFRNMEESGPKPKNIRVRSSSVNKRLVSASELEEIVSSLDPKRKTCAICTRTFPTTHQVTKHEIEFHLTKEDRVEYRNRRRPAKPPNSESATHTTGEKDWLCNICGVGFARAHTLQSHELAIHKKERRHKCQYCGKTFVFKYVKDAHERKHTGASKVTCHICGFVFSCKQNLTTHIKGIHENQRPYKCHLCDKSFKTSTSRHYHVKTHNNPNGRKRGLNREVDDIVAAAKRRNCFTIARNRIPELTLTPSVETSENPIQTPASTATPDQ